MCMKEEVKRLTLTLEKVVIIGKGGCEQYLNAWDADVVLNNPYFAAMADVVNRRQLRDLLLAATPLCNYPKLLLGGFLLHFTGVGFRGEYNIYLSALIRSINV